LMKGCWGGGSGGGRENNILGREGGGQVGQP